MNNAVLGKGVGLQWTVAHPIACPALEVLHLVGIALLLGSLVLLALPEQGLKLPADLATRKDRCWLIELAPLSRMQAWGVPEIKPGDVVAMLGFTLTGEKGEAVLRVEYLFAGGKAYGLRSSPA
jgi:hypothetical protein